MLEQFFALHNHGDAIGVAHNLWLVTLSVSIALLTSIIAMHLAVGARLSRPGPMRTLSLWIGALTMGIGIWGMHFVGMLAVPVFAAADYATDITIYSTLPALLAGWCFLRPSLRVQCSLLFLVYCSLLGGIGVGGMHYLGTWAIHESVSIRFEVTMFLASVAVVIALSFLSLLAGRHWLQRWPRGRAATATGVLIGLSIAAMHYVGMVSVVLTDPAQVVPMESSDSLQHNTTMALTLLLVVVLVSLMAIVLNVTLRLRKLLDTTQRSEARMRAMVDTAIDGIILINGQGIIEAYNGAAQRMLGWTAEEAIGHNISMLMPEPHRSMHDHYLQRHLRTGKANIIGIGREMEAQHKNGALVPIRLTVGRVDLPGEPLFVGFITDLSQRREIEHSLQRSEQQLSSLVSNMPGVAFRRLADDRLSMLFISDMVEPLTGWRVIDFLSGEVNGLDIVHPEDRDRVLEAIQHALWERQPYLVEYRLLHRDGTIYWVSERGRGSQDEHSETQWIDGVIMDHTAMKMRNAEFEGMVTAVNGALALIEFDMQRRIIHANDIFLQLYGYQLEELVGQSHRVLIPDSPEHLQEYETIWTELHAGRRVVNETMRLGRGGRQLWIQASYNPISHADGSPHKVVVFATDLTQRRAMEEAMRQAKEHAEMAAAARSTFLANMSHEIRTPMNAIIGFTEALLETELQPTQRRHLGTVHLSARSMLRLLNDILDTAKLDKGAVALELQDFSLRELCEQTVASLRITAQRKQLPLRLEYADNVPPYLHGDALRLQQILTNLLGNAIKFTEQGEVVLCVTFEEGWTRFAVSDTGIGIAEDQIERIFAPFAQADASTTRRFGGTGLGTTIARQLVELMGGRIEVQSVLGQGSTFTVHLPLPLGKEPTQLQAGDVHPLPPLNVLAADDVPHNLELLQLVLGRHGHTVALAHSGREAVEQCTGQTFDIVLMDLQMPDGDGMEATRQIRRMEHAKARAPVPIIALSASVLEQDRRDAFAAGMDGFATKPVEPLRLFAEMARVLSHHPALRQRLAGTAVPAVPAVPPAPGAQPLPVIDWQAGLALWADDATLRQAIARFLQAQPADTEALEAALQAQDWNTLAAAIHRVQGVAGNLALRALQAAGKALEQAARQSDAAAARTHLDAWRHCVAEVEATLQDQPVTWADPALTQAPAHPTWNEAQRTQALPLLEQLEQCLMQCELDAPLLERIETLLPLALTEVRDALDAFDFDAARTHLQTLRQRLAASTTDLP